MDVKTPIIDQARGLAQSDDPMTLGRLSQAFGDLNEDTIKAEQTEQFLKLVLVALLVAAILLLLPMILRAFFALFDLIFYALS